ncbi:hypothetical protein V6N13_094050 [Hibiscus sabdariffa]
MMAWTTMAKRWHSQEASRSGLAEIRQTTCPGKHKHGTRILHPLPRWRNQHSLCQTTHGPSRRSDHQRSIRSVQRRGEHLEPDRSTRRRRSQHNQGSAMHIRHRMESRQEPSNANTTEGLVYSKKNGLGTQRLYEEDGSNRWHTQLNGHAPCRCS